MATIALPLPNARAAAPARVRAAHGLALMVVLALVTRLPFWGHPAADYDEQLYSLIGRHLLAGELPYTGLWDRKPIGLFAIYAVAHGLFGPGAAAYQAFALFACLAGGWLTFRLAARMVPPATAAFAAALYPPLMAIYGSHSGQSEVFFTPLLAGMALLVLRGRDCAETRSALHRFACAMALGGLALQVKYSALPACALFGGLALANLHRRRLAPARLATAALAFAALGLLPTLAAALPYAARGELPAFVFANFTSIRLRGALPLSLTLSRQLSDLAPLAALALAGVLRRRALAPAARREWAVAAAWLLAGLGALFLSATIYPYYYAALVPAVILVALPLFASRTGALILGATLAWLMAVFNPIAKAADARAEQATLAEMARAIGPGCLYVHDGPLALHELTGSALPTRLIYPDHLNNAAEARALPVDPATEIARIMARRPHAVVTSPTPVNQRNAASTAALAQGLAGGYRLAGTWSFQQRPLQLFIRQDPAPIVSSACGNSISKSSKLRTY